MATAPRGISIDVYLHSDYEPDAEYVDGEIEERAVGTWDHSSWQDALCAWFRQHGVAWNVRARPELSIQVSPTRFRVPDVTVLDRNQPIEQIITHAPLAVFEILSPEDTVLRLKRKLEDYRLMGIVEIWVFDPNDGTFSRYTDQELRRTESFSLPSAGIAFAVNEIKALLD